MDPTLVQRLLDALTALKTQIAVGVPIPQQNGTPLIIGSGDAEEIRKATIWGATVQVGKFFPNTKDFGFLKPLTSILNSILLDKLPTKLNTLFEKYFEPVGGGSLFGSLPGSLFGLKNIDFGGIGTGVINLGIGLTSIALAFKLFDVLDIENTTTALMALGGVVGSLVILGFSKDQISAGSTALLKASAAIGVAALGLMLFKFVDAESYKTGMSAFAGVVAGVALLSLFKTQVGVGAATLLLVSASLIPLAFAFSLMGDIDWTVAATAIGGLGGLAIIAGIIGGLAPLAAAVAIGSLVIAGVGLSLLPFAGAVSMLGTLTTTSLPQIGTDIGLFLTNLVSSISFTALATLPALIPVMGGIGMALTEFGKFIPVLITLPIAGLVNFGSAMGKFFEGLTENITVSTLIRTTALLPLLRDISPVLLGLGQSINVFTGVDTSKLPQQSLDINKFFENLDIDVGWFGDAEEQIKTLKEFSDVIGNFRAPEQSFTEFINAFSKLGNVKINVDIFSNETKRTNDILTESISIQRMQLEELRNHSKLLANAMKPVSVQPSIGQPYPSQQTLSPSTRMNYERSPYFIQTK